MSDNQLIKQTKTTASQYDIFLPNTVGEVDDFLEVAWTLEQANEKDFVVLHLGNHGGDCHGCIYLVNYVRCCKAPVMAKIMAPCSSAGATLALCGDGIEMAPNTYLMFHNYSSQTAGKAGELELSIDETRKWIHTYFKDIHYPFLTATELRHIKNDRDVYIHANDKTLKERCTRHFK